MKRKRRQFDDPVVAEVRAIRARLWKEAGGTVDGFLDLLRREGRGKANQNRRGRNNGASTVSARRKRKTVK